MFTIEEQLRVASQLWLAFVLERESTKVINILKLRKRRTLNDRGEPGGNTGFFFSFSLQLIFSRKETTHLEIWKPLRNFPSYNGSSEGRIMNIRTQRILKTFTNEKGYEKVCLRKNNQQYTVSVHKVIAETFLGEHPGMDVRHKDLDRSNNRVDNLEWCTRAETIASAYARGTKRPRSCRKI